VKFPLSDAMVRHAGRNRGLSGGSPLLTLNSVSESYHGSTRQMVEVSERHHR
jgi:hypothetical protein